MAKDKASDIIAQKKQSLDWMKSNYYSEWESTWKLYKCQPEQLAKADEEADDAEKLRIALPDTFSLVRRQVARITAQIPNLRYKDVDAGRGDRISRKLMHDWDRGGVQRLQKRHVTQACLFGWSVRPWWWEQTVTQRSRRVDPFSADNQTLAAIHEQYATDIAVLQQEGRTDINEIYAELIAEYGRGKLLPVKYDYIAYEGPRTDFLFVGDCFPEPEFPSLQQSRWFIVRRRRTLSWLKRLCEVYPQFKQGVQKLYDKNPKGTPRKYDGSDENQLRRNMLSLINRTSDNWSTGNDDDSDPEYTILERHIPGYSPKLAYVGEDSVFLGEIDYPYDLDSKIAFTELVLIDDLLGGVGDSHARIIRGLNILHNLQVNTRNRLIHNILRPYMWTSNRELYENPELLSKSKDGYRLVALNGGNEIGIVGEQAAIASAAAGLQDESAILRAEQMASGESNMSMAANVDPQQGRTATGARLLAYNQDLLTKDFNDAFTYTSITADADMMRLLNRSELAEGLQFDGAKYNRNYSSSTPPPSTDIITVSPEDFSADDADIEAEAGSTIADDDEGKLTKAQNLFALAASNPALFNVTKARDEVLIAFGKGRELEKWAAPPAPPPPPEQPKMSISIDFLALPLAAKDKLLHDHGLLPPEVSLTGLPPAAGPVPPGMPPGPDGPPLGPAGPPPGPGGPAPGMPMPPPPPPPPRPVQGGLGSATAAAEGRRIA